MFCSFFVVCVGLRFGGVSSPLAPSFLSPPLLLPLCPPFGGCENLPPLLEITRGAHFACRGLFSIKPSPFSSSLLSPLLGELKLRIWGLFCSFFVICMGLTFHHLSPPLSFPFLSPPLSSLLLSPPLLPLSWPLFRGRKISPLYLT